MEDSKTPAPVALSNKIEIETPVDAENQPKPLKVDAKEKESQKMPAGLKKDTPFFK